jgi:hypothetical protein
VCHGRAEVLLGTQLRLKFGEPGAFERHGPRSPKTGALPRGQNPGALHPHRASRFVSFDHDSDRAMVGAQDVTPDEGAFELGA